MPVCSTIKRKHKKISIGDMDQVIILMGRSIVSPNVDVDYDINFKADQETWSMIETVSGVTKFDGANIERVITHKFYIHYDPTVTNETWIRFDERNFSILLPIDLGERKEFMELSAYEKGDYLKQVNYA